MLTRNLVGILKFGGPELGSKLRPPRFSMEGAWAPPAPRGALRPAALRLLLLLAAPVGELLTERRSGAESDRLAWRPVKELSWRRSLLWRRSSTGRSGLSSSCWTTKTARARGANWQKVHYGTKTFLPLQIIKKCARKKGKILGTWEDFWESGVNLGRLATELLPDVASGRKWKAVSNKCQETFGQTKNDHAILGVR